MIGRTFFGRLLSVMENVIWKSISNVMEKGFRKAISNVMENAFSEGSYGKRFLEGY